MNGRGVGGGPGLALLALLVSGAQGPAARGEDAREVELRELGLLARIVYEPDPAKAREERKSGVPGFEVRSDEQVFGLAHVRRPWLLELRVEAGEIALALANDSREDFSIESVRIECHGLTVAIAPMPQLLRSNALESTCIARLKPEANSPRSCEGRITSDHGATSQLTIHFSPLHGDQAHERTPQ